MPTTTRLAGEAFREAGGSLRVRLFERIMERIHRYFVKLVWDPDGVDECVQRTLVALDRSLREGAYDPRRSFNRWMWIKAHSIFVDYCRERSRQPSPLPDDGAAETGEDGGLRHVEAEMDAEVILERLRRTLDPEALEVFLLHYDEERSITDIAAILGRDRKTVRARLDEGERAALRLLGVGSSA